MGFGELFSDLGNSVGAIGGLTQGISKGFTPQNDFRAQSPLDIGALQNQLTLSQGNLATNQAQQQALAQALLAQSQGTGPNPVQAALNAQTGENIAQNNAFIASQKGIDPGQAARLAAQNQGMIQQKSAGQAALLNAQQQLGAQQSLGNLYGQIANQNLQNAQTSGQLANGASLGSQQINAGTSAQNAAGVQNTNSGLLNGIGGAFSSGAGGGGKAHGGFIEKHADGGFAGGPGASSDIAKQMLAAGGVPIWETGVPAPNTKPSTPSSVAGAQSMAGGQLMAGGPMDAGGAADAAVLASGGGEIPGHLHRIAKIYHPNFQAKKGTEQLKSKGGSVPGKAMVQGDSPQNDTVKTMLSPGELVIPRSVMESKDPVKAAANFVAEKLKEKQNSKGSPEEFKDALKKAIAGRKGK